MSLIPAEQANQKAYDFLMKDYMDTFLQFEKEAVAYSQKMSIAAKKEAIKAGDIVTILLREGTLNCVTEEAIDAGDIVFYKDADGSVTKVQPAGAQRMGFAVAATAATEGGTFIPVLVC